MNEVPFKNLSTAREQYIKLAEELAATKETLNRLETLEADRRHREGWLVEAIEGLPASDRATVERAVVLLGHLADADVRAQR